jgi:phage-related protein
MKREIIFYKNYFIEFYLSLDEKTQNKVEYVLNLIKTVNVIPSKFFKHIESTNGLYEVRVITQKCSIRIFCCLDKGQLVVLLNSFIKKQQKTPKDELTKAKKLMNEYFINKKDEKD